MLVWCQMCPGAWDLVYHKPIVRDITPCSSDITLCSAKSIIHKYTPVNSQCILCINIHRVSHISIRKYTKYTPVYSQCILCINIQQCKVPLVFSNFPENIQYTE